MLKFHIVLTLLWLSQLLSAQIQVIDDQGLRVTLSRAAERVIALSPHTAELMLASGVGSKLIATAAFDDYPRQISTLPVVSSFSGLDRERLIMLNPDLVVAWASGNKANDIAWVKSMGIPVYLSEPLVLEDIPASMEKLGHLCGQPESANRAAMRFLNELNKSCPDRSDQPLQSVYYEIWPDPPMTIGGRHWLNQVLEKAGLQNIFADQNRQILSVTPEALLARPVEVKISSFQQGASISAAKKKLVGNDLLARPGPGIIEGLRLLCDQL